MEYREYNSAQEFLSATRHVLERNEALYGLMLGVAARLVDNLFHYGDQRPYLAVVSEDGEPCLIALLTPPHKLQLASFSSEPAEAIGLVARGLRASGRAIPAVLAEEHLGRRFATEWTALTGMQHEPGMRQRLYRLDSVNHPGDPGGHCRQATAADLPLATEWNTAFYLDCFGEADEDACASAAETLIENGHLYFWEDSMPVAMAGYSRPTTNGISIGSVYTPPHLRRRGYASALVASISGQALDEGKHFCTLYTDLGNPTSNSIYQKIGYQPVADIMDVNFSASGPEEDEPSC